MNVGNLGEPIRLTNVALDGVAAAAARGGETIPVWTRLALTSDDPIFHRIAEGISRVIRHCTNEARVPFEVQSVKTLLLVIKPDQTAELWADTAAVALRVMAKRSMAAGSVVFDRDIVDVSAMAFPAVGIDAEDKVICLFRQDWRFALYFDFNPSKNLNRDEFERNLASLYRSLKYRHIYDSIAQKDIFARLVAAGWFPFAEIIASEFRELVRLCEVGFDLKEAEDKIVLAFDEPRLDRMLDRWLARPHFASREIVLRSAIRSYKSGDPVAVIKTVLTEIEGILNAAHRATNGTGAKIKTLLAFAAESAERKAGSPHTLLLPEAFNAYLTTRTFAPFDPLVGNGTASSRHAVGHGEADPGTFTQVSALQALLTLDQFAFST